MGCYLDISLLLYILLKVIIVRNASGEKNIISNFSLSRLCSLKWEIVIHNWIKYKWLSCKRNDIKLRCQIVFEIILLAVSLDSFILKVFRADHSVFITHEQNLIKISELSWFFFSDLLRWDGWLATSFVENLKLLKLVRH